jgi:hypothetical protein
MDGKISQVSNVTNVIFAYPFNPRGQFDSVHSLSMGAPFPSGREKRFASEFNGEIASASFSDSGGGKVAQSKGLTIRWQGYSAASFIVRYGPPTAVGVLQTGVIASTRATELFLAKKGTKFNDPFVFAIPD